MCFILKLVLMILFNKTSAYITQNDSETIILPAWKPTGTKEIPLTLKAFKKEIRLNLRRNDQIVSSASFKVWKHDAKGKTEESSQLNASDSCYYHHKDHISSAVINFCQQYGWEGLIFLEDDTLEIRSLQDDFASLTLTDDFCVKEEINISFGKLHLIKKLLLNDSSFYDLNNFERNQRHVQNTEEKLNVELAVFFDEAAYRTFMPFLDEHKEKLRNIILAYVNNIQAVFHHPSLGVSIDISLVHLEIMDKQPLYLPIFDNETQLLDSFCKYAIARNPSNDNDPGHWDVGLYLTGIDIKSIEGSTAVGLANVDSLCDSDSCAIVEFGARRITSGFSSSLTAAHEIGHVLGIEHDSEPCETNKYIMSSVQNLQGQVTWSECSRNVAEKLWDTKSCLRDRTSPENLYNIFDHSRYHDLPGREWTAKAQCEIYFPDKDANVISLLDICKTLQCETPHKNKSYFTGPALEGTYCAHGKECRGGECVPIIEPPYNFKYCDRNNWSEWKADSCNSKCLEKSKGVEVKRRFCKHRTYRTANCQGPYYDVVLCDDSLICDKNKSRQSVSDFTEMKCAIFSLRARRNNLSFKILRLPGRQTLHDVEKPWIACTIFCRRNDMSDYYAPRLEMLDSGTDPYFPDGTWCHHENGQDYYCRQHYCLPESYS